MKPKKVVKSLAELYAELLESETATSDQKGLQETQAIAQPAPEPPKSSRFRADSGAPGYLHWGINE